MIQPGQIEYLARRFGYTESEARFLYLIAAHSGYFFHKQYARFLGIAPNKRTSALIKKALRHGHMVQRQPFETENGHFKLYHLCSRRIYEIFDLGDSNLRRNGTENRAQTKVMITSFLVAHPKEAYLETESEKVEYFTQRRQIDSDVLPKQRFRNRPDQDWIVRYFVDKFPIYLEKPDDPANPAVVFTYFDDGLEGMQQFKAHLNAYRPLLLGLNGNCRMIYAAASDRYFERAEACFRVALKQELSEGKIRRYFIARSKAEAKQFGSMSRAELADWHYGKKQYPGKFFEELYQGWKANRTLPETMTKMMQDTLQYSGKQFETVLITF